MTLGQKYSLDRFLTAIFFSLRVLLHRPRAIPATIHYRRTVGAPLLPFVAGAEIVNLYLGHFLFCRDSFRPRPPSALRRRGGPWKVGSITIESQAECAVFGNLCLCVRWLLLGSFPRVLEGPSLCVCVCAPRWHHF